MFVAKHVTARFTLEVLHSKVHSTVPIAVRLQRERGAADGALVRPHSEMRVQMALKQEPFAVLVTAYFARILSFVVFCVLFEGPLRIEVFVALRALVPLLRFWQSAQLGAIAVFVRRRLRTAVGQVAPKQGSVLKLRIAVFARHAIRHFVVIGSVF